MTKIARIYHEGPDRLGRYQFTELWVDHESARADGPVLRGQVFFCVPPDRKHSEVREFSLRWSPRVYGTTQAELEASARAWLTEGIELTPTCSRCGMGETRHVAPHVFTPED